MNSIKTIKLTLLIVLLSTLNSFGQPFKSAGLDSLFKTLEASHQAMGSVSVSRGGKAVYNKAFGFCRMVKGAPQWSATATEYRIGSITKIFTAVMILQLAEEHKLTLATPLSKFFPQIPNAGAITIDELLSHRSGIHNFTGDADYNAYAMHPVSKTWMLTKIAHFKPDFKPGQKTGYSNTNYLLLGYIIEQVTGKSYNAELQLRIANKIGLRHTGFGSAAGKAEANQALCYNFNGSKWLEVPRSELSVTGGAGAMVSSADDMSAFMSALFKGKLINQASLNLMTNITGKLGRGLAQIPVADQQAYGNFGVVDGFKSTLLYLPQSDVALAVCFNSANTNDNVVVDQILTIILKQLYQSPPALSIADLAKYQGTYISHQLPGKVVLKIIKGRLTLRAQANAPLTLQSVSRTRFRFAPGDMTLDFIVLGNNTVKQFSLKQGNVVYDYFKE